jgi:hypothetical protein
LHQQLKGGSSKDNAETSDPELFEFSWDFLDGNPYRPALRISCSGGSNGSDGSKSNTSSTSNSSNGSAEKKSQPWSIRIVTALPETSALVSHQKLALNKNCLRRLAVKAVTESSSNASGNVECSSKTREGETVVEGDGNMEEGDADDAPEVAAEGAQGLIDDSDLNMFDEKKNGEMNKKKTNSAALNNSQKAEGTSQKDAQAALDFTTPSPVYNCSILEEM